jgi:hypothetical protein
MPLRSISLRRRTLIPLLVVLFLLLGLGIALYLRAQAPPEAARLLPESDAIVYIQLKTLRSLSHFDASPVTRSADFQRFIDATGIVPERDLDSAAFALHRMADPRGPNGPVAYSEVFTGRFDGVRLANYLHSLAKSEETYAGHTVYTIPSEGRSLRIAQLAYDTVAASNMPTPEQIHSMLDRSRASAVGTPGSSLLAARYPAVPLLSQAWGIGHIGLPFASARGPGDSSSRIRVLGLELPLPADTDLIASLRYGTPTHLESAELRIEEIAPDAASAQATVETLTTLFGILRGVADAQPPHDDADAAMRQVLDTVKFTQHDNHALLTAHATLDQIKAISTPHPPSAAPQPSPASK